MIGGDKKDETTLDRHVIDEVVMGIPDKFQGPKMFKWGYQGNEVVPRNGIIHSGIHRRLIERLVRLPP
jgi:hypothetical protein